jgi:hypothetical protein
MSAAMKRALAVSRAQLKEAVAQLESATSLCLKARAAQDAFAARAGIAKAEGES